MTLSEQLLYLHLGMFPQYQSNQAKRFARNCQIAQAFPAYTPGEVGDLPAGLVQDLHAYLVAKARAEKKLAQDG